MADNGSCKVSLYYASLSTKIYVFNNSYYNKPKKLIHLSYVHCNDSDQQILSCTHIEFTSLDKKKETLNEVDMADVICCFSSTFS